MWHLSMSIGSGSTPGHGMASDVVYKADFRLVLCSFSNRARWDGSAGEVCSGTNRTSTISGSSFGDLPPLLTRRFLSTETPPQVFADRRAHNVTTAIE